jgi:hypothetical protein
MQTHSPLKSGTAEDRLVSAATSIERTPHVLIQKLEGEEAENQVEGA